MGKGYGAVHHKRTQVGPLMLTFQFQLMYAVYHHRRTLKPCRLGDVGGIMEMQPQQGIDCPQLGNYTATK